MGDGNDREQSGREQAQFVTRIRSELSRLMQPILMEIDAIDAAEHGSRVPPQARTAEKELEDVLEAMNETLLMIIISLGRVCRERSSAHDILEAGMESVQRFASGLDGYSSAVYDYMSAACSVNLDLRDGYAPMLEESFDKLRIMSLQPEVVEARLSRMAQRPEPASDPSLSDEAMTDELREADAHLDRLNSLRTRAMDAVAALRRLSGLSPPMSEAELDDSEAPDLRMLLLRFCTFARAALGEYSSRARDVRRGVFLPTDAEEVMALMVANTELLNAELTRRHTLASSVE